MLQTIAITAGAVIFATLILLALFGKITPAIVMPDYKPCAGGWHEAFLNQCHPVLTKIPQQPVNTYSNLAFLAAGVFIARFVQTPPAAVFGFTMIYLFIGSTLYHALSTRWAGMLDVTAIFAIFSATATYALGVLVGSPVWLTTILMFVVGGLAAYLLSQKYKTNTHLIIGIFLGATYLLLLLNMWLSGNWAAWPYLVGSFVAFAVAFFIWNRDLAQTFPLKGWGHGIWHVLASVASALVFYAIHLTP
jgi:channel protein (hemolysin III family)